MSKQISSLDPRQADELVQFFNPIPDDYHLTETLICLNLLPKKKELSTTTETNQ